MNERREHVVHENPPAAPEQEPRNFATSVLEGHNTAKHASNKAEDQPRVLEADYVIDHIFSYEEDPDGRVLYRVRSYSFQAADDTLEPIEHLSRSHVVRYCGRRKLKSPDNLEKAQVE